MLILLYRHAEQIANGTVDMQLKHTIDELLCMESHCAVRKNAWIWQQHAKNVIVPLRDVMRIDDLFGELSAPWQLTDEFLQKICGILDVNTFEVRTPTFEVMFIISADL